jgi:(R,R)-butanediol dehydrogenase/meso-butanediol dehydrogenase/diacetyl reductase
MLAGVFHGPGDVRVEQVPDPCPGPREVLIKVDAASLCGTDLNEFEQGPIMVPLYQRHHASGHLGPTILGHEFTGTVLATGADVDPRLVSRRVVPGAGFFCGRCPRCVEGRPNLCDDYYLFGIHAHGGMAEWACVPATMCHPVPDGCDATSAALAQPFAVALHAVRRSGLAPGESVVVIGAGGIGAFIVAAAAASDPCLLIAVDINTDRLQRALTLGAHVALEPESTEQLEAVIDQATNGAGADVVIEASGRPAALTQALRLVRHGGRVQLVGIQPEPVSVDWHAIVVHEINVLTSNGHICVTDLPEALALLTWRGLAQHVIGRQISLANLATEGLSAMAAGKTDGKVVVSISGS